MKIAAAIDRGIQRRVDAGAFWLMRRGVPKSQQTFGLSVLALATAIGWLGAAIADDRALGWLAVVFVPGAALHVVFVVQAEKADRIAEARGLQTARDHPTHPAWRGYCVAATALNIVAGVVAPTAPRTLLVIMMAPLTTEAYLRNTPRQPPPEAKKAPVKLSDVPATQGT